MPPCTGSGTDGLTRRNVTAAVGVIAALKMMFHVATADVGRDGVPMDTEQDGAEIHVCRGLKRPWSAIWPQLRFAK